MKELLNQLLNSSQEILVTGDLMLDRYISGGIERISPEAPVPVLNHKKCRSVPGGAGNVARNLSGLQAKVHLVGLGQEDEAGIELKECLDDSKIQTDLISIGDRPTTRKTRFVSGNQQLMRLDEEETGELTQEEVKKILSHLEDLLHWDSYKAVLISDYNKGFCHPDICSYIINEAQKREIPVVVDPKGKDWVKYNRATIITPNVKELSQVRGFTLSNEDEIITEAGKTILQDLQVENLLITRSEKGLTLLGRDKPALHLPTQAREVYDVSGAGDTVAASLCRFLSGGASLKDCAALANRAAALVIAHWGTYPISSDELKQSLNDGSEHPLSRLLDRNQLQTILDELRRNNQKIVFTNGCFDLLHRGHVTYLQKARSLGDRLILGLNSDNSVRELKGKDRPLNDQESRALLLLSLRYVDYVVIFDEQTPLDLIRLVEPDILVKGGDYKPEDIVGREFARETVTISFVDGFSTTELIKRMT